MNDGRIEQIGTQTDIYLAPARRRIVAEFIGANNGLRGTVAGRDGDGDDAGWLIDAAATRSAALRDQASL